MIRLVPRNHFRYSFLLLFWYLLPSHCADHGTFKNCSRVDFCTTLRSRTPSDDYSVDTATIALTSDGNSLKVTLVSSTGAPDLLLTLNGLQSSTFRLRIREVDSSRYELRDVLDGEPQSLSFDAIQVGPDSVTVTTDSGSNSARISYSPFEVAFVKEETTRIIFDGGRLTLTPNGPFAFGLTYPVAVQLYGAHEHCDTLALKDTLSNGSDPYRLRNLDVANYELESPMALYASVPVVYGHGPNGTAGVFLHNAAEQWIDTTSSQNGSRVYFMVETGALDLFIMLGPSPLEFVRQYTKLTGKMKVPPFWTVGYHQSRYSYSSQDEVTEVISNFTDGGFPLDAIWLDIGYTDGYRYFTWNPSNFSDPVAMQETIADNNKTLVTIINPHIKVEAGYGVYDGALANDLFVKNSDGSVYQGPAWPGASSYVDFLNPSARDYVAGLHSYENFAGSTSTLGGVWNDMNEPSVFDTSLENTLPSDALHYGNVTHKEVHNIYGLLQTMSTYQGLLDRDNGTRRPFVLTRSHFAGSQRYAAFWTGENTADWSYLLAAFQQCLNANMLGMVFCGADVGGFFNNPSSELLERWYQGGAWLPFYRANSNSDTDRREPYFLPEDSQNVIREAIRTRYYHIPQWYTLLYENSRFGDPVIRPLFYHYPDDPNVYTIDNEFLVGPNILIHPITEPGIETLEMYFPGGPDQHWFSIVLADVENGTGFRNVTLNRDSVPIYYRYGGVVVRKETSRLSTTNQAHGSVYLDDGISFDYRDNDNYNYNNITMDGDTIVIEPVDGNEDFPFRVIQIVRRDIAEMPRNGRTGRSSETVYTKVANGTLLRDLNINLKVKTVLKLD